MVDLARDIEIGIGSRRSKVGAAKVNAALESIKRKSRSVHAAGARDAQKHARGLKLVSGAAVAMAAILGAKSLVKSQIDFGQAIADLSAITGAVGEDLDFLRRKSKEFGETTTLSASQAAEAFRVIASAKPDLLENVEALSMVTEEAIALAEATGDTLPTAANVMASALNQFGEGADQASRFINVLAAGSKRGAAVVGEMGESLKAVGVIASMASLSFEQTNAALQLMSTRALKGGEAGMQMRGVLLALTAQSQDKFKPEVVGLTAALDNLATAGLDEGSEALDLFGRRNLAAAATLIQGRVALEKLTTQLTGTNIAYEQQAIRIDTLSGDIKAMKSAYEGLELTIGAGLNSAFRSLTQSMTANLRAASKNPLLQSGIKKTLDTLSIAFQDVANAIDSVKKSVSEMGGGAAVFEGVWQVAIENIIKWTKFLWEQFVVGGPANLKLAFTLMIAAADRLRIGLVEKIRTAVFLMLERFDAFRISFVTGFKVATELVARTFVVMRQAIANTFDTLKVGISEVIDDIIGSVQQKVFSVARLVGKLGFDERAKEITDVGIAIGKLATFEEVARKELEKNAAARKAELAAIDEVIATLRSDAEEKKRLATETADALIKETEDVAEAQRLASQVAVQGAIEERDATIEAIKALRQKRKEIVDGAAAAATIGTSDNVITDLATEGADALGELGEKGKLVFEGIADGLGDMAAEGKLDFKSLAESIIADLIRIQIRAAAMEIFSTLVANFGGGGESTTSSATVGGVTAPVPAQHGVDFKVKGSGGIDSQNIFIKATPGERITVRTPQQQTKEPVSTNGKVKVQFVVNNFSQSEVEARQSNAVNGDVLIEATIGAVASDIGQNGPVFQAMRARQSLGRR